MKRKKRLSAEQIRYYVPGIKNRFFDVHKTIILVCMLMVFVVVTFYAAYLSVTSAAEECNGVMVRYIDANRTKDRNCRLTCTNTCSKGSLILAGSNVGTVNISGIIFD